MVVSWHMHDAVHGEVTIKGLFWGLIALKKCGLAALLRGQPMNTKSRNT